MNLVIKLIKKRFIDNLIKKKICIKVLIDNLIR